MIAGIETGGTKVICGVSSEREPRVLLETLTIPTTNPSDTVAAINDFLDTQDAVEPIVALGLASFGPVNVEPDRERWGWVTGTPKKGWADTDLAGRIRLTKTVPTTMISDVASAAVGEQTWGAGSGSSRVAYATFGTGVGVGIAIDGSPLHGNGYPEMGHLLVRRHPADDFSGACPFHGDCLEGLASGPAVKARWGRDSSALRGRDRDIAFEILGYYIAQLAAATAYTVGVERFIVGGGVVKAPGLFEAARTQLVGVTGGAGASHAATLDRDDFLAKPGLGDHSGVLGAIASALRSIPGAARATSD